MEKQKTISPLPGDDFADVVKGLRIRLGLTQQAFADRFGVAFVTVNRWENKQTKPSKILWEKLRELETASFFESHSNKPQHNLDIQQDFTSNPNIVKILAEGERLSFGFLANPTFATEISQIDPLPHQRIAVYEQMLLQNKLRFLLADDAGAGKTIMSGLYIREMLLRHLLKRIMIVAPAGLVGNWRRELQHLFSLEFKIITGNDTRNDNPFSGENSDFIIISIDTLGVEKNFAKLQDNKVLPYDLVIFDEAHKLGANRGADMRITKTDRYKLAEALAGVPVKNSPFHLTWAAQHLLLLTATPHMGKHYPYYALWRLLDHEIFSTPEAFESYPADLKQHHFIRRTKEEMVYLDGRPLYPKRISDTLTYELTTGNNSEQTLYDETTDYLRYIYNKAKLLNREAAQLAMSVFQRRLASSTYSLLRSFERRIDKLNVLIDQILDGKITEEQMLTIQARLHKEDLLDTTTADEEGDEEFGEKHENAEDEMMGGFVAASLIDLQAERETVQKLLRLAKSVYEGEHESKFEKLNEILMDEKYIHEKFIIFTEHRDTLNFLVKRLRAMGYTEQVAQIHGGMIYTERETEVEKFRKALDNGGARFLICTDAAGEGINLQFCWLMINYDIPWNPARLEQRMGRIHRYGQKHNPVIIMNFVAASTREGKVLSVLLNKLDKIREELHSDKVFDCIGRIFENLSIKEYMRRSLTENNAEEQLDNSLTKNNVLKILNEEKEIYGTKIGDVAKELPQLRTKIDKEVYCRLLPGYTRQYIEQAAPLIGLQIDSQSESIFSIRSQQPNAMIPFLSALEKYPENIRHYFSYERPVNDEAVWIHPGEPVFEQFRQTVMEQLAEHGQRGAIFTDPTATKPYLFHTAIVSVIRKSDTEFSELSKEKTVECRMVGVRRDEQTGTFVLCPVEHFLLLQGTSGLENKDAQRLAVIAAEETELARAFLMSNVLQTIINERKEHYAEHLPQREQLIRRGYEYREMELAAARTKHNEKAKKGNKKAADALEAVKIHQRELFGERDNKIAALYREPELLVPGEVQFITHALVVPATTSEEQKQFDADVERIAMQFVQASEEANGAKVFDVHTPPLARQAGLSDNPGFDLLSRYPDGEERCIEVKGRAKNADVEMTGNEWAKACNLRNRYWLYAVFNCAESHPQLVKVQDPFYHLLAAATGSMILTHNQILKHETQSIKK